MMGQTRDPETLVVNQAKTTLCNNPKAETKSVKSFVSFLRVSNFYTNKFVGSFGSVISNNNV
jgi:hypothetical protein